MRPAGERDPSSREAGRKQAPAWFRARAQRVEVGRGASPQAAADPAGDPAEATIGGAVTDRIEPLNAAWNSTKLDVARAEQAGEIDQDVARAFLADWDAWRVFYDAHRGDWVDLRTTLGEIESRRQRLEQWREALRSRGATVTGPETQAPPPGLLDPQGALGPGGATGLASSIATGLAAMAVIAVVAGAAYAAR